MYVCVGIERARTTVWQQRTNGLAIKKLSFMFYVMNEKLNAQIHKPTQIKPGGKKRETHPHSRFYRTLLVEGGHDICERVKKSINGINKTQL